MSTELECVTQKTCGNSDYTTDLTALIMRLLVTEVVHFTSSHWLQLFALTIIDSHAYVCIAMGLSHKYELVASHQSMLEVNAK